MAVVLETKRINSDCFFEKDDIMNNLHICLF